MYRGRVLTRSPRVWPCRSGSRRGARGCPASASASRGRGRGRPALGRRRCLRDRRLSSARTSGWRSTANKGGALQSRSLSSGKVVSLFLFFYYKVSKRAACSGSETMLARSETRL